MGNSNGNPRKRPEGYYFITPVWGEVYTRLYLELGIPSQLAAGNLPAFKDLTASRYVIITNPEGQAQIERHPIFARLQETIEVVFQYLPNKTATNHDLMSLCHKQGIDMADAADCAALFLNPDLVFADGSFRTVREKCEEGYDTVITPGIRTLKQGVLHRIKPQLKEGEPFTIAPRELMRVALDNLHPLANSSWWEEEKDADLIPATLYWRVGDEGIVSRNFHLHPLMVYPQRKGSVFFGTIDDDYMVSACPDGRYDYIVRDSDELLTIELSDPAHLFLTGFRKESVEDTSTWAEQFAHARHRMYFDAVITMHTGKHNIVAWDAAEKKSQQVVDQVKAQLKRPSWQMIYTDPARLKRRLTRWSLDHGIEQANTSKELSSGLKQSSLRTLLKAHLLFWRVLPATIIISHHSFVWKFALLARDIYQHIYGPLWFPYPWAWRWRHFTSLRKDLESMLTDPTLSTLIISHNKDKSLASVCCASHEDLSYGHLHQQSSKSIIINQATSEPFDKGQFDVIIVERTLAPARQVGAMMEGLAQMIKPEGQIILIVNRVPSPSDRLDHELCLTTPAINMLIAPEFTLISQQTQGRFALGSIHYLRHWVKLTIRRFRIPLIIAAFLATLIAPLNVIAALLMNAITFLLDKLDTTGKHYISSITLAKRSSHHE